MTEHDRDQASAAEVEERNAQARREAVARQWKAGLTDTRIAQVLGLSKATVTAIRESLGLPRIERFQG